MRVTDIQVEYRHEPVAISLELLWYHIIPQSVYTSENVRKSWHWLLRLLHVWTKHSDQYNHWIHCKFKQSSQLED